MKPGRGSDNNIVDDIFYADLRGLESRFDLLGKSIDYRAGSEGVIDIMRVDVDDLYVEFIDVPHGSAWSKHSYDALGRRASGLEEEWTYVIDERSEETSFVDDSPPIEGDLYFDREDEWKFHSRQFQNFSYQVLGYSLLEEAERISYDSLDI